ASGSAARPAPEQKHADGQAARSAPKSPPANKEACIEAASDANGSRRQRPKAQEGQPRLDIDLPPSTPGGGRPPIRASSKASTTAPAPKPSNGRQGHLE